LFFWLFAFGASVSERRSNFFRTTPWPPFLRGNKKSPLAKGDLGGCPNCFHCAGAKLKFLKSAALFAKKYWAELKKQRAPVVVVRETGHERYKTKERWLYLILEYPQEEDGQENANQ
jgi:hypothetical protein